MQHRWLYPIPLAPWLALLLAAGTATTTAVAQRVRAIAPAAGGAIAGPQDRSDEEGVPVELFENLNLDRYLRRAQDFLGREDYAAAIQVLQDVVEGKTVEVVGAAPEPSNPAAPQPEAPAPRRDTKPAPRLDARQSVFSQDGRLYRPIRRLCHELLARLPAVGLELYRATYEVIANEMLEKAMMEGTAGSLEAVANRYFITLPAGRAMALLADRLMHEGRHRAAVQVLRDLVELYPPELRRRLGISDVWCGFKIALCLRLAGEQRAAHDAAIRLATEHPTETLRVLGELQAVKDLPTSDAFASEVVAAHTEGPRAAAIDWFRVAADGLVPLWQYRFRCADPYRDPKAANDQGRVTFFDDTMRATTMPHAGRYGGGTQVSFAPGEERGLPMVSFLEHFRLCVADAASGVMVAASDQPDEPPPPRENHPRVRIAASDFALLRPVDDEARRYVVVGHRTKTTVSTEALRSSELQAYDRASMQPVWSSSQWYDGDAGLADVTFLAAPIVFGERLLLPSLRRGAYTLECIERTSGRPLWNTPLHAGGTPFWKAPGSPVALSGGTAFVLTNAGCVAAVDAFSGDLRWVRRYERSDPVRTVRRARRSPDQQEMNFGQQFQQSDLKGFLPNELIVTDGLVVCAPCDSDLLMCIDGATGEPAWIVDGTTRYAPYGTLRSIVGAAAGNLFATSDRHLVCIGLTGGLVKWCRELPLFTGKQGGRGRGVIAGNQVLLPSEREVLVFDVEGRGEMQRMALPSFDASRDPMGGAITLAAHGPWLAVGHPGGIEMFSTRAALTELAAKIEDPLRKANCLVLAGARPDAERVLAATVRERSATSREASAELLQLVSERALVSARGGDLGAGLAALDGILDLCVEREVRMLWHLARIELCKAVQDLRAHEREQQRLYDFMEGKG